MMRRHSDCRKSCCRMLRGRLVPMTLSRSPSATSYLLGQTGDFRTALRLAKMVLRDRKRVLGADHADTLRTRNNIAQFRGQMGHRHSALGSFKKLLRDRVRLLGADDPETLATRHHVAGGTAE